MAMQELTREELDSVSGGLGLGLPPLSLDLGGIGGVLLDFVFGALASLKGLVTSLLSKLPAIPVITIPGIGITIG